MRTISVSAVAAVLLLAACSEDGDIPRLAASSITTVTSSQVTARPTTTTAASSTTAATTTSAIPTVAAVSSTSAPTGVAELSIERQLGDRVRAFFRTREAANAAPTPNPDDPRLAEVATGAQLEQVRAETAERRAAGQALRPGTTGNAAIHVGEVQVEGAAATVSACSIDDGVVVEVASGRVVDDKVVTHQFRVELQQVDGVWKVSGVFRISRWEGVVGCALALGNFPY